MDDAELARQRLQLDRDRFAFERKWYRAWAGILLPLAVTLVGLGVTVENYRAERRRTDDANAINLINVYLEHSRALNTQTSTGEEQASVDDAAQLANCQRVIAALGALEKGSRVIRGFLSGQAPLGSCVRGASENDPNLISITRPELSRQAPTDARRDQPNCPTLQDGGLTVYIQYRSNAAEAEALRAQLNRCDGVVAPAVERVASAPDTAQIRYYRTDDREMSASLSRAISAEGGALEDRSLEVRSIAHIFTDVAAPANVVEVWLP